MQKMDRALFLVLMTTFFIAGSVAARSPLATLRARMGHISAAREALSANRTDANVNRLAEAVRRTFDFDRLASESLGRHLSEASEENLAEYKQLFADVVERSTVKKLETYEATDTEYGSPSGDTGDVFITTIVTSNDGDAIAVRYYLHNTSDGWRVYDMILGTYDEIDPEFDISTAQNYRDAFHRIITKDGWEKLLQTLREQQE